MNEENKNYSTPEEEAAEAKAKSESTLFAAPPPESKNLTKRQKQNSMKKQRRTIIIMAIIVIAAICAYFFVVLPIVNYVEETKKEEVVLLDGEVLGVNDRIMLFGQKERSNIESIEIHNSFGEWGIFYDYSDEAFYITGYPEAPYDKELFSSLVTSAGYTLSMTRVTENAEDMSEFGLADKDNPAWYTLKTRDGESHTVYIGDMIPTGAGYYCRYKDRNAVYVLDSTLSKTLLQPLEVMITPMLSLPMQTNDYFTVKNFAIMKGNDVSVLLTYLDEDERAAEAAMSAYKMLAPANYTVNSTNYSVALEALTSFQGTSTLVYDPTEDELKEYGLLEPAYTLSYEYQGIQQMIVFSEKNESGNYYAYSLLFNLITEVDGSSLAWLDWDIIKWVDQPIFMMNINDVETITVESDTAKRVFDLVGEGQELVVTERDTKFQPEVKNFRQFYKTLLSVYMQDYVGLTEEQIEALDDSKDLYMTLTIETRAGVKHEYKFYPYSTRRSYYTVNGKGEFYVLRDMVTKIITDAEKVMTNTVIDSEAHS
ncbi:MAG: DUF4340 domain-containing protein [Clostridiales bacterium]|nr:DUF4340 domain-containing protein [Clostridiales bacterium]